MKKRFTKVIITTFLSLITALAVTAYGANDIYAAEFEEQQEVTGEENTDDTVELSETDTIVTTGQFEAWYAEAKAEAAKADHIIGPGGDISTNKYTLVMPGETIAILPEAGVSNKSIQGNITRFDFTVLQLDNPSVNKEKLVSSTPKANGFTAVKEKTVLVPFSDRTVLDPPKEAVASHDGPSEYTYVSLYKNDTGLPIVLKGDYYNYPCTEKSEYLIITGKNDSDHVNFQGWISVYNTPEIYFLEPSYDISIDDSSITGIKWPGNVENSAKLIVSSTDETYKFDVPVKAEYRFAGYNFDKAHVFWEFDNKEHSVKSRTSVTYTFNFQDYVRKYGINKVSSQKLSPTFKDGCTLEFHAQGGTVNGKDSYLCEAYFYGEYNTGSGIKEFVDIDAIQAVKDNCTFVGWCTNPDNAEATLIKDTTETGYDEWNKGEHTDLYAVWKSKESPKPPVKTSTGTVSSEGIYVFSDSPSIVCGLVHSKSDAADDLEFRWLACDLSTGTWTEISPWITNNEWLNWTPKSAGNYLINCYVRVIGNEANSEIYKSVGVVFKRNLIKDICQMPYDGGGYLIGFETFDNPNQEYQYEMFVMDLSLLAAGSPTPWVHDTGAITLAEGKTLWTVWQPEYGYYITLFRLMDKEGNILDEVSYGFANAY